MIQGRSILFGALFLGGLLVIGWLEYYPSSGMFEAIGLPGPRANTGRKCGAMYRKTIIGFMPTRALVCNGAWFFSPTSQLREEVDLDGLTRKILYARRIWTVPDSAQWQKERDAVVLSLDRRGGHHFACEKGEGSYPHIVDKKYWRFSNFYVRMVAYDSESTAPERRWMLQLDGYPQPPLECLRSPRGGQPPEEGCNAEDVLRMRLPGDRVLCVKTRLWN